MPRPSIPIPLALSIAVATGLAVPMLAGGPAYAAATTYHVDCSAAANGDGGEAAPWNSLDAVNAAAYGPGDTILFKRGTRCAGAFSPQGSGLAGSPIVVDAYGDAAAAKPGIDGAGATNAVLLDGQQYWELRNLDITNTAATTAPRRGVYVRIKDTGTAKGFKLTALSVHDVSGDGTADSAGILFAAVAGTTRSNFDDVVVDGAEVSGAGGSGIALRSGWSCRTAVGCSSGDAWTGSTGVVVRNSTVGGSALDGISLEATAKALVERNTVHTAARSGQTAAGIRVANSDDATVQANEIRGGAGPALEVSGGSSGALLQYNYTHENDGGSVSLGGSNAVSAPTVRYNIGQNDGGRLLAVGGATDAKVYNNSFHLATGSTTKIVDVAGANPNQVAVANNIFDNRGTGGYDFGGTGDSGWTWSNNIFHGAHPAGEPTDTHKITLDPQFSAAGTGGNGLAAAGAYKLAPGSPARGIGLPVTGNGGKDFFGATLPAAGCAPDIGAHQRNPSLICLPYNHAGNPGFENGVLWPWTAGPTGTVTVGAGGRVLGAKAVTLSTLGALVQQTVKVQPNTAYTVTGFARPADWQSDAVRVGVKDFGGAEVFADNTYPFPMQLSVAFTTGADATSATIYCTKATGYGAGYCDDLSVNVAPPPATPAKTAKTP